MKNRQEVFVNPKFIYCSTVYKMWRRGASLMDEKYYSSDKPLNARRMSSVIKKKNYEIRRFISLEGAPEDYLLDNGYNLKNNN